MKETLLKQLRDTAKSGDMASITDEFKPWETMGNGFALEVSLFKTSYVLAWGQFIYAEGDQATVKAVFSTHDLVVKGSGLLPLLSAFAQRSVSELKQPGRTEKFERRNGPVITDVLVTKVEG